MVTPLRLKARGWWRMTGAAAFACVWACAGALALLGCGHSSGGTAPAPHKGYPSAAASPAASPTAAAAPAAPAAPPPAPAAAPPPATTVAPAPIAAAPAPQAQGTPLQPASAQQGKRGYEPPMPMEQTPSPPGALRFSVRGVDHTDVLNVRSAPGPKHPVVGEIPPEATGVVATGARRQIGPSVWREVTYGNLRGWVNERFLVEERELDPNRRGDRR